MIDLKNYRIIDVSAEIHPGVLKINGEYIHGRQNRRFEIRQFQFGLDGTFMHWVETETHIGTHVELPAHLIENGESASEMPVEIFLGEAVVLRFDSLRPKNGEAQAIKPSHLNIIKEGDIVLMWSPYEGKESPYISVESAEWLRQRKIKMLGVQNIGVEESSSEMATHKNLLKNGVPIIENMVNLEQIGKERVFYIGLPLKVARLDSSWIRAIVLEPKP